MDSVDYICFSIIGFLTCICLHFIFFSYIWFAEARSHMTLLRIVGSEQVPYRTRWCLTRSSSLCPFPRIWCRRCRLPARWAAAYQTSPLRCPPCPASTDRSSSGEAAYPHRYPWLITIRTTWNRVLRAVDGSTINQQATTISTPMAQSSMAMSNNATTQKQQHAQWPRTIYYCL